MDRSRARHPWGSTSRHREEVLTFTEGNTSYTDHYGQSTGSVPLGDVNLLLDDAGATALSIPLRPMWAFDHGRTARTAH